MQGYLHIFLLLLPALFATVCAQQTCPLCGQSPVSQAPAGAGLGSVEMKFDICCPHSENNLEGCVLDPLAEAERVSEFNAPIIPEGSNEEGCITLRNLVFEKTNTRSCCVECSCAGDPNCISFDGDEELWVVCDGRTVPDSPVRKRNGFCKITEDQCGKEIDPSSPNGAACQWLPTVRGIDEKDWSMKLLGSPCQPAALTELVMYEADGFKMSVFQGDRGYIKEILVSMQGKSHKLTANDCVRLPARFSWSGDLPVPRSFKRRTEVGAPDGNNDHIWDIIDQGTGIGASIRCTSTKRSARSRTKVQPYINVESLFEPNPDYESDRANLGGFCHTNDLGNENPSRNTLNIERRGYCHANAASENVTIARLVCQNPSITKSGVNQCRQDFCRRYGQPLFDSFDECSTTIHESFAQGFCEALNENARDLQRCLFTIETEGWEDAVRRYLSRNRPTNDCVRDIDEFPVDLAPCEKGVSLQYYDESKRRWVNFRSFPEHTPPCADALFSFCSGETPELFTNRIRLVQMREVTGCLADKCLPESGFGMSIEYISSLPPQPLCPPENREPLNILDSTIRFNNLGGKGPVKTDECPFIWFENVMNINGESVDLAMRVMEGGTYQPSNEDPTASDGVSNNGKYTELGQINVRCGTSVPLEFIFLRHDCAAGLADPCSIPLDFTCDIDPNPVEGDGLIFTTYDLDEHERRRNREFVDYCNVDEILEVKGSKVFSVVKDSELCPNSTRFSARTFGTESDNPTTQAFESLTLDQIQKLGQMRLASGLSRIVANYTVLGPDPEKAKPRCGRRILFSADFCRVSAE